MQAKELALKIRQAAEELTRENKADGALIELLKSSDLPSRDELFQELRAVFCTATVPGIIARLQETLTPCQSLEDACRVAQRALVLAARHRLVERTAEAPGRPQVPPTSIFEIQTLKEAPNPRRSTRIMEWYAHLLGPIALALGCAGAKVSGESLEVAGDPYDITLVQTIFAFLDRTIERLAIDQPKSEREGWKKEAAKAIGESAWEAYSDLLLELSKAKPLNLTVVHAVKAHKDTTTTLVELLKRADEIKRADGARGGRPTVFLTRDHPRY